MTLKERIHSGEPFHIGLLSVDLSRDAIREKTAGEPWDLALVDLQHIPFSEPQLADFCRTAAEENCPVMLRIPHPRSAWLAGRFLDFGAAGVLVPMVEEPGVVEDAVDNFYYPPVGRRSAGLARVHGRQPDQAPRDYADWWNANGILALQIESVQAVRTIRELVRPGADLLLFGGVDLGFSIESEPDGEFRSVEECCRHVVEATRDLDVRVGLGNAPFGHF
jgi:2-keto-3-deoxy-L-rhamnonate aldolase RhmA